MNAQLVDASVKDFKLILEQSQRNNPDVYFIVLRRPACDFFVKQLRESYPRMPVTGCLDYVRDKNLLEGSTFISEKREMPAFDSLYANAYGTQKYPLVAVQGYDTLGILAKAWQNCGGNKTAFKDAVCKIQGYRGMGGVLSCEAGGIFNFPTVMKRIVLGSEIVSGDSLKSVTVAR